MITLSGARAPALQEAAGATPRPPAAFCLCAAVQGPLRPSLLLLLLVVLLLVSTTCGRSIVAVGGPLPSARARTASPIGRLPPNDSPDRP